MPGRDEFGLPTVPPEEDQEFGFLEDDAQPPAPQPIEEVEAPLFTGLPTEEEAPESPEVEVPETLYANKYRSVEALEKGYREMQDLQRRTAERAKIYEQAKAEADLRAKQYEQTLRKVLQTQIMAKQAPPVQPTPQVDEWGNPVPPQPQPGVTPEQFLPVVDALVQNRMRESEQMTRTRMDYERAKQDAESAVMGFYESHPDVEMYGEMDAMMHDTIQTLNDSWTDSVLDIRNPDSLEVAYEAAKDPQLLKVLQMNPRYVDDEEGMKLARLTAALLRGEEAPTPQTAQVPASMVGQRRPFVEKAATVANPTAERQLDEFDEAVAEYRKHRARGGETIFFE